ncbi:hypothetical protein PENSOL_c008G04773 [Penicillium solitum]|uniref:Zn(2)-C6 fungal-type domain-containing protein n=1 Tax=Penicillium solitum TaxID=60172 RepID=A0A1V6RBZ9_9EURO|nr:uncharacterized protein PENSOL_c008G04773 [Penicillium solitum]OQD98746.1 hypothetical protein PENSOL_c008G04773 [Penicillium solitum]
MSARKVLSRACDSCRCRKTKCSGTQPCPAYQAAGFICLYRSVQKRRGPKTSSRLWYPQTINYPNKSTAVSYNSDGTDILADRIKRDVAVTVRGNFLAAVAGPPNILEQCLCLYMQFNFPIAPIVHEASIRTGGRLVFSDTPSSVLFQSADQCQCLSSMRTFALATAVCASVAAVMPTSLLPCREQILQPALHASRDMLAAYEDFDLEYPDSSSLAIRLFQSTALQHLTGRIGVAWHVYSQATLLAHRMRLHDEQSLPQDNPTERKLLRYLFWHMNLSDISAAILSNRVALLRKPYLSGPITLEGSVDHDSVQLTCYGPGIEDKLLMGYHLGRRVWDHAADIVDTMRSNKEHASSTSKYSNTVYDSPYPNQKSGGSRNFS